MKKKSEKLCPGFVIAGVSSGSGKTLLSLGLMEALRRRAVPVRPFKAGPDYIDPGWHRALLKIPSYNLDTWMMGTARVKKTFRQHSRGGLAIVEGAMGLYDGRDGKDEQGSTAHLSKILKLPVLLVVNASKLARSIGAIIKGFESYDPGVDIRWAVFNMVGSPRHFEMLKDSIPVNSRVKVLGYIPRDEGLKMPERHLGLFQAADLEKAGLKRLIDRAATLIENGCDLDSLTKGLAPVSRGLEVKRRAAKRGVRIAVARDGAFSFYYEENLEILVGLGAELVCFSPLRDKKLPEGTMGVYLGGGYPELHAKSLEANSPMRNEMKKASARGLPIYAECGGLMYLGRSIEDRNGETFRMAGVFPWKARMLPKRKALGYREAVSTGLFMKKGERVRGHEFHYSEINPPSSSRVERAFIVNGADKEGFVYKNTLATYIHLHFASNPAFAKAFVDRCAVFGGF